MEAAGGTILTLSPQLADFARAWAGEDGIDFDVLIDSGNGVARSYGLTYRLPDDLRRIYVDPMGIDLSRFNGDETWELAMPATYIIGRDGIVAYTFVDADYTVRPEPDELLAVVRTLAHDGGPDS